MPPSTFLLHIPQPCAASWDAMTPAAGGRHCATCQKTVVDFSQKTDAEILALLAQATGPTCGRLRAGQVRRPLQPPATRQGWRGWLGALLAAGSLLAGGPFRAAAQPGSTQQPAAPGTTGPAASQPATSLPANTQPDSQPADTLVELRGIVLDAERCEPLPGVTVLLKNTSMGTVTDAAGEFVLRAKPSAQPTQLLFRFVGFISQEQPVLLQDPAPRKLEVALDAQFLGGLLVSYSPPAPWHPRALFNWGKYWLTRPFRH